MAAHQYSVHVSSASPSVPLAWPWRDSPVIRFLGAAFSWLLFTFSFTTLYLTAFTVMSIGGYCASGGPYQIEVQCPDNVLAFTPWNIFGGMHRRSLSRCSSRRIRNATRALGMADPLHRPEHPFFYSAVYGAWGNIVIGLMFAVMGLGAVWIFFKGGGLRLGLLGKPQHPGQQLHRRRQRQAGVPPDRPPAGASATRRWTRTRGDWMLALGVTVIAGGSGIYLALLAWDAAERRSQRRPSLS